MSKQDFVLNEFTLTYMGCLTRVQMQLLPDPKRWPDQDYLTNSYIPAVL